MKRILLLSVPLAFLAGCGPVIKKGCKDTGCGAGSICNTNTGTCESLAQGGGGGGGAGGGSGGGSGGGAMGGGGGSTDGGGVDAGPVVDPFDDGGVFSSGDICTYAIPVTFDGGASADGGAVSVVTVTVDLAQATHQYKADCNTSSGEGNDVLFQVTLTEPKGLIVSATDTSGKGQDAVMSLVTSPCALFAQAACVDTTNDPEVLAFERLPPGTYYVLLENDAPDNVNDGTYDVEFELVDPPPGQPNDQCSGAAMLTFTNGVATATGTTEGTFNDTAGSPLTCSAASALAPEVFYSVTLTQPQDVTVTVDTPSWSSLSPAIALTNACGQGGASNQRGCRSGSGRTFTARSVPAGTYFVVVDGDGPTAGEFSLQVVLAPPTPQPANDTCATPTTLVPNVSQMADVNMGSKDYTFSCASPMGGDVVYEFTTTMPQKVTLTATGVGLADGVLSLRAAPCDADTNEVDCVDLPGSSPDVLTVNNLPPGTWYVVLAAFGVAHGQFGLELALDAPVLPPSNETCATPATLVPNMSQMVDLGAAASDYTQACATVSGGDAVYQFTTTQAQRVVVTATSVGDSDAVLSIRGAPCDTAMDLACANNAGSLDPEIVASNNLPAGTYYVILGSDGVDAQFGIELALEPPRPPPTNESCTLPDVVTLTAGAATRFVDLTDAAADIPSDLCSTNAAGTDVVYEVTIPAMQTLTVVGTPVGFVLDVVLFAKSPVCTMAASEVCIDRGFAGDPDTLVVPNTTAAPKTVFVVVKAFDIAGPGELNLTFRAM
ncbi:MAG: hypothetical protein Q8L48_37415 [Archangium sp.]|nr:hypothetical protein [Archangium sp.]